MTILNITKGTKPRADMNSPRMEKTQIELLLELDVKSLNLLNKKLLELDVKSLNLLNKKHTEMLPIWSLLKRLYPSP